MTCMAGEAIPPGAVVGGYWEDTEAMYVASFHNVGRGHVKLGTGIILKELKENGWFSLFIDTVWWRKKIKLSIVL